MEDEPQINLRCGSQEYELRRDNTFLYRFMGALASRDHIFIREGENTDGLVAGRYMFRQGAEELFDTIADYMDDNEYFQITGQNEVSECDEKQYQHHPDSIVKDECDDIDYFPEEWQ